MDQHYLFLKSLIEDRALSHKTFRVFYINVPLFIQKVQKSFSFVPCFLAQPHSLPAAQPASHPASRKNSMTLLPPLCNKERLMGAYSTLHQLQHPTTASRMTREIRAMTRFLIVLFCLISCFQFPS